MRKTVVDRFWDKVNKTDTCWEWTGKISRTGYGEITKSVSHFKTYFRTHRFSYELHFGKIKDGLFVCHSCDNRKCVNPVHLFLGTIEENHKDMVAKNRHYTPRNPKTGRLIPKTKE